MQLSTTVYPLYWQKRDFRKWYHEHHTNVTFLFEYAAFPQIDPNIKYLSMAGWAFKKNSYLDYLPSIPLQVCTADTNPVDQVQLNDSDPIYLGNLKLKLKLLRKIYKELFESASPYDYIVFKPMRDAENHLYFEIYVCPTLPDASKSIEAVQGKQVTKADPSPPATSK